MKTAFLSSMISFYRGNFISSIVFFVSILYFDSISSSFFYGVGYSFHCVVSSVTRVTQMGFNELYTVGCGFHVECGVNDFVDTWLTIFPPRCFLPIRDQYKSKVY